MAKGRVTGATKLIKFLKRLPEEAQDEVKAAVKDAAEAVHFDALVAVPKPGSNPYSDGDLLSSLQVRLRKDGLGAKVGAFKTRGKNRAAHAHLIEFGVQPHDIKMPDGSVRHHPGHRAMPFLLPAFKKNLPRNIAEIRKAIDKALTRTIQRNRGDTDT